MSVAISRNNKVESGTAIRSADEEVSVSHVETKRARAHRFIARKDHDNVAHALVRTSSAFKRLTTQRMKEEFDITGIQAEILMMLAVEPDMLGHDLAAIVGVNASTITHALDVMEKQDLLTRRRCTEDRRVVRLALTEKAKRIARRTADITHRILDTLTEGISPNDLHAMQRSLERMANNCQTRTRSSHRNSDVRTARKS